MGIYDSPRRKRNKARQRQEDRRRRRTMAVQSSSSPDIEQPSRFSTLLKRVTVLHFVKLPVVSQIVEYLQGDWMRGGRSQVQGRMRDGWWYITHNRNITRILLSVMFIIALLYPASYLLSGRVFPNVKTLGINVGGVSVVVAEEMILNEWSNVEIELTYSGEILETTKPHELGITLDVAETAKAVKNVGISALPFGKSVEPIIKFDALTAQNYFLDMGDQINTRPVNAGFRWQEEKLIGVAGREGQRLDVALSIEALELNAASVMNHGQFEMTMIPIPPDGIDAAPFMEEAQQILENTLELKGYDPYANQHYTWPIDRDTFASWLAVGSGMMTIHESQFLEYMDKVNTVLNPPGKELRYIDTDEASNFVRDAIAIGQTSIDLRVRYHATQYEVETGDTLFRIARKTGIPYFKLEEANSGININFLVPGQKINVPTRDVTMPHPPDPHKRIVVDLVNQHLIAYEDNQIVFDWSISSGVKDAPTSPGIYQILSHSEEALGSSITLCNAEGIQCGQWKMNWFMGIYEVQPGVVNGFHGDVLLPNGNFLGEGLLGFPATFGCVMSSDGQAYDLYQWANVGTVVEIVSNEYTPLSDLGRNALNRINST